MTVARTGIQTILGAGGAIGRALAQELLRAQKPVRLGGRHPQRFSGAVETVAVDVRDPEQTMRAVVGSAVVYLVAGLKYDTRVWGDSWPRIMNNVIEACKRAGAKLVFFDNVYMYGKVAGAMTEETAFNPCSKKGEIRAQIATALLDATKAGSLTALIARSADFYGPGARTSIPVLLVFDKLAKGRAAYWLVNDAVPHSFTFVPDAARGVALLADSETAWNQTWHLPTAANPPTGRTFIGMAAQAFGVVPKSRVLRRPVLKIGGWFDSDVRESYEMLYQYESDYVFDSGKFHQTFDSKATSYAEGIRRMAESYQ